LHDSKSNFLSGKRQEGGDTADHYFLRTECIAGVKDMRFQALMPDVLHWLGIQKIDRMMVSFSYAPSPNQETGT
jgi:GTP cyclohydrolase II